MVREGEQRQNPAGFRAISEKMGAVETQAAIRWNDPRHPQARDSFGAVPLSAPVGWGGSILNGFPSDCVSDDLHQRFATGVALCNDRLGTPGCLGGWAAAPRAPATIACNVTSRML
jgi:hypothetical protein